MSDLNGKWKLVFAENVGEYCKAIGTPAEFIEKAMKKLTPDNDITQTICCNDTEVSIVTEMPGKTTEVKASYGQPVETKYLDDRLIQTTFSLDGQVLKEEQSGAFQSSNVRIIENGQLIYKMTSGGITTPRKYDRM